MPSFTVSDFSLTRSFRFPAKLEEGAQVSPQSEVCLFAAGRIVSEGKRGVSSLETCWRWAINQRCGPVDAEGAQVQPRQALPHLLCAVPGQRPLRQGGEERWDPRPPLASCLVEVSQRC